MRIAWFRAAAPDAADPLDDTALLIDALRARHVIDVIDAARAHDFVWQHFLRPWDLCVYELDQTPSHEFVLGYLVTYPGVVVLRSLDVAHLRVPVQVSRAIVTSSATAAELLRARYPDVQVRAATPGVGAIDATPRGNGAVRFLVIDDRLRGREVVERAFTRARDAGAVFEVMPDAIDRVTAIADCDVLLVPGWPPFRQSATPMLAGLAAGKTVVSMETDATASWPAIDPQTWRPRGLARGDAPIAVTIDPRDEEHSLMLAVRRLSSDAALRGELGRAARAWWQSNATPAHAEAAWSAILEEAARLSPPPRPGDWPAYYRADGRELTRGILTAFGLPPTDILARS